MKKISLAAVLCLVAALLPSAPFVCAQGSDDPAKAELATPGDHTRGMTHAKLKRTWRVHVPKGFKKGTPVPLVFAFHGMGSNGDQTEALTGFTPLADKEGFAVCYPEGNNRMWQFWDVGRLQKRNRPITGSSDDFGFVEAIINELVDAGVADKSRVYSTGISNGGYLSNALACVWPDKFAAVAPVAGTLGKQMANEKKISRAVPVLYIHGTADKTVGYDGEVFGIQMAAAFAAEEMVEFWVKQNRCGEKPAVEMLPDTADDGTTVERRVYSPSKQTKDGAPVVFYKVIGGGHTWPGGMEVERLGVTSKDFSATEAIWEFFKQHRLPDDAGSKEKAKEMK